METIRKALSANPHLRTTFILDYHRSTRLNRPAPASTSSAGAGGAVDAAEKGEGELETKPLAVSTAHLLLPLIEEFGDRVDVWFFRSPNLKGLLEKVVPERYDEGWGTWHGKWYAVDDEVILSGYVSSLLLSSRRLVLVETRLTPRANLAGSYFTNRQDRYVHFRSHPSLLSYLSSLTRLYSTYSYLLSPHPPPSAPQHYIVPLQKAPPSSPHAGLYWHHPSIHPRKFATHALATLTAFQNSWRGSNAGRLRRVDVDTFFWPVIQAGVLGIKEEEKGLGRVWDAVNQSFTPTTVSIPDGKAREQEGLQKANTETGQGIASLGSTDGKENEQKEKEKETVKGVQVDLTSGYFGLYDAYKRMVIDSPAPVRVIAASPKVCSVLQGRSRRHLLIVLGKWILRFQRLVEIDSRGVYLPRESVPQRCGVSWSNMGRSYRYRSQAERMGTRWMDIPLERCASCLLA